MFRANNIGLDIRHIGDFKIDRPNGSGDYLLVVFKTNARLVIGDKEITVPPDSAVIFEKGERQLYGTICGNYVNHFLHFDVDDADVLYDIELNRLLVPENIREIETHLRMLSREMLSLSDKKDAYIDMLIKMLLMKLSEEKNAEPVMLNSVHGSAFLSLRAQIYSNAGQFCSVSQLAKCANISLSHFKALYKKLFGISCYEDLLSAKIKLAQFYLSSTDLTVKEIALLCGYETDTCFMRRFKGRTHMTPREYRQRIRGENNSG